MKVYEVYEKKGRNGRKRKEVEGEKEEREKIGIGKGGKNEKRESLFEHG
jgi:hypothetical protein